METIQTSSSHLVSERASVQPSPSVALVTCYNGGNLGDAAIQDAMIANFRARLPGVRFFGITLDPANFRKQHGIDGFPMLSSSRPGNASLSGFVDSASSGASSISSPDGRKVRMHPVRRALRAIPGLIPLVRGSRARWIAVRREIRHSLDAYRILRKQDLLVLSGGGQLDEEYGGPWRLPYSYFKWILLARLAHVPCAIASIGAGKLNAPTSRRLLNLALRLCSYRSFREARSRSRVADFLPRAANDPVVPDLAFTLPVADLPPASHAIRQMAAGRPVVAVSPICYAKPGSWPTPNLELHDRYVQQLAKTLCELSRQGYFLVVLCSSLVDDEGVIPDLLARVDDELKSGLDGKLHLPAVKTWRDFVSVTAQADFLIASRLHGTILSFVSGTPVVAISFDPKVDWVMEDLRQTDYLLHIADFTAQDALDALLRLQARRESEVQRIRSCRKEVTQASVSAQQYDSLAALALKHSSSHR